jgi:hypothetical protein
MSEDKRKNPRIDFYLPVTIKGHEGVKEIKDFSLSGLFVEVEDPSGFARGDMINLVIELPYDKPIVVKARVMRLTDKGIGVEFVDLHPEDLIALGECFDIFKYTIPMPES